MKTILLADDEANLRMLARITLDDPMYRILEAEDGLAALKLARNERPDLLVLDWMMPGLSGIEVARLLHQDPETAHIPVIMLTARGQEADRAQGRDIGVHAHLVKPFSPLDLLQKIQDVWKTQHEFLGQLPTSPSATDLLEPTVEIQQQLNMSSSQLALYVRDLRQSAAAAYSKAQELSEKAEELSEANSRLQILDRLKIDFLAFISHELRTPLNTISAVDILDPQADPKDQREVIAIIRRGYERLHQFIEKGLEYFNWLAASRADLTVSTDLARAVTYVIRQLPAFDASQGEFSVAGLDTSCHVRGAITHWISIIQTLLDNAIKFSHSPQHIQVHLQSFNGQAVLTVTDQGQGFPPELAREVFRPFTIANTRNHSRGSGLSLSLASVITEAYGGTIQATSPGPGKGATFTVSVPLLSS
ncbi:MAG: response regulator [Deltaproteobacteria bacterium]|nr:response regulator [Deltaproteobacteria bacterium]